jgi:hypothetical protein
MINKDMFKQYMNTKYVDTLRVDDIISISVHKVTYTKSQIDSDSGYYDLCLKQGFVILDMVIPVFNGYKKSGNGRWYLFKDKNSFRFNLESYNDWIVEMRDNKLELMGI